MVRSMSSSEAGPGSARSYAALGMLDVIFRVGEGLGCAINPKILVPSPESLFLSGPEVRRCDYRHNFEVDQVVPSLRPRSQRRCIWGFHHLKTLRPSRVYPARLIDNAFGQHPPMRPESLSNRCQILSLESLDDHE
jgi:hypothetical protein